MIRENLRFGLQVPPGFRKIPEKCIRLRAKREDRRHRRFQYEPITQCSAVKK